MRARHLLSKTTRLSLLGGTALLLAWGCGDSTDERLRAAKLSQTCSINSDCEGDLVCVFERCHIACEEDRDCDADLRCVAGGGAGVNVCQLDDETACRVDKDCPGEQVCGVDDECRDACSADVECVTGQVCATSGECASTVSGKDELDSENNIVLDGAGPNGGGGAGSGAAGAHGGGHGGAGGTGVAAGSPGLGTEGGVAGQGPVGGGGDPASGGGAAGTGDLVETEDGVETVLNGDREHPVPLSGSATIYLANADEDWFSVQAPDDGRAHVIHLTLQQQAGLRTAVAAEAAADFAPIGSDTTVVGATTNVYVSVGPGTTTLLKFAAFGGGANWRRLDLTLEMTSENDEHEPNNTLETATPIQRNTEVTAQLLNGFASANGQADDGGTVDWYEVQLEAGTATLSLTSTPSGGRIEIHRVKNGVRTLIRTTLDGEFEDWPFPVAEAGPYHIRFAGYAGFAPFTMGAMPSYISTGYKFQVVQE